VRERSRRGVAPGNLGTAPVGRQGEQGRSCGQHRPGRSAAGAPGCGDPTAAASTCESSGPSSRRGRPFGRFCERSRHGLRGGTRSHGGQRPTVRDGPDSAGPASVSGPVRARLARSRCLGKAQSIPRLYTRTRRWGSAARRRAAPVSRLPSRRRGGSRAAVRSRRLAPSAPTLIEILAGVERADVPAAPPEPRRAAGRAPAPADAAA
jgi:hypothetical protein